MANPGIFPGAQALMPQQAPRTGSDWAPREYWVQPPNVLPPPPPFKAYVPPAETIVFGDSPRDQSRYQTFIGGIAVAIQPAVPPPPPPRDQTPQQFLRDNVWSLRDYRWFQDGFSGLNTPALAPPNPQLTPQVNPRPDWTLRDYTPFQAMSAWFENLAVANVVPPNDIYVFSEFERDMTPYQLTILPKKQASGLSGKPPPFLFVPPVYVAPYDLTAAQSVVYNLTLGTAFSGIPKVPSAGTFAAYDYDPVDLTPYLLTFTKTLPPSPPPQIPPSAIPFIEWPGWQPYQYQTLQDQFSALGTPPPGTYPKGLVPQFTLEALIRDLPRPWQLPLTFLIPPPPPFVFAEAPTQLETPQWLPANYQTLPDQFSAWAAQLPVLVGFRVMAVTAGLYGGNYYNPGDVFDIVLASDYSDSTKNYQAGGGEYAAGWMIKVPSGTALFQAAVLQINFIIPDPKKRTVM